MKKLSPALTFSHFDSEALAMQSCESTGDQTAYHDRGHNGYYHDNRYAEDTAYESGYAPDDYQSDGAAIDIHLAPDYR